MLRATALVDVKLCKIEKVAHLTYFEQKNTHISRCKIVHLCTIATITMHICTVTVAYAFIILLVFSLYCLWCSPFFSFFYFFSFSLYFFFLLSSLAPTLAILVTSLTNSCLIILITGVAGFIGTHWSDEAMNEVMNKWFVGAKILRFVVAQLKSHSHSWWFVWWWWWRWEDLRKFCLICLKFELFGLWEYLGCCLDVL